MNIKELLGKDLVYKITSVMLAFLLWFFVTNLQNPTIDKPLSVPLNYTGLKEGLDLDGEAEVIELKLRGPSSVVTPLTAQDIKASVDLSQAVLGESSYQVDLKLPEGVQLVSIKPGLSIPLKIDAVMSKQLSIQVKTINSVAEGYSSYEPVITPSMVVVKGAQNLLSNLEEAQVTIDLKNTKENLALSLPVNLIDKNGSAVPVNLVELSPKTVQVYVPVIQNVPTKAVAIKPVLIGKPKESWQVSRIVLEPEMIRITGPYERLSAVDHVLTQPIDITGISEDMTVQVALTPPDGVSLLYNPAVNVLIRVAEAPVTKTFTGIPLVVQNLAENRKAELSPQTIAITVQGSREEISVLKESDIKALLDLIGLEAGSYEIEVKVGVPENVLVLGVQPGKIQIKITGGEDAVVNPGTEG